MKWIHLMISDLERNYTCQDLAIALQYIDHWVTLRVSNWTRKRCSSRHSQGSKGLGALVFGSRYSSLLENHRFELVFVFKRHCQYQYFVWSHADHLHKSQSTDFNLNPTFKSFSLPTKRSNQEWIRWGQYLFLESLVFYCLNPNSFL